MVLRIWIICDIAQAQPRLIHFYMPGMHRFFEKTRVPQHFLLGKGHYKEIVNFYRRISRAPRQRPRDMEAITFNVTVFVSGFSVCLWCLRKSLQTVFLPCSLYAQFQIFLITLFVINSKHVNIQPLSVLFFYVFNVSMFLPFL